MAIAVRHIAHDTPDKETEVTYRHVVKYTGLFGGVQGITTLMNVVRNKVAAVLLGPEGMALVTLYNNAMSLLNQSTNFGISFSAVRHVAELAEHEDDAQTIHYVSVVRTWSVLAALFGVFVTMLLSSQLSQWTFGDHSHATDFLWLAPIVGLLSLTSGEAAILKGLKKLKRVALVSVFATLAVLIVCVPCYVCFGTSGIVPALVLSQIAVLAVHLRYTTRLVPWHTSLRSMAVLAEGVPMVRLGIGFILAGVCGQGAEYLIRTLILHHGTLVDVGLYSTGYQLAVTYAGMVFVAVEADFFPRLSSACSDAVRRTAIINQQTDVCVLLMAPFLTCFIVALPLIVPLLFSGRFVAAIPMATCATLYMFFKSLTLPAAYLPLACGDSAIYMIAEVVYDVCIAIAIPMAYAAWGLVGTGWALGAAGLFDCLFIHIFYRLRYGFRLSPRYGARHALQFLLLLAAIFAAFSTDARLQWGVGIGVAAVSCLLSGTVLYRIHRNA